MFSKILHLVILRPWPWPQLRGPVTTLRHAILRDLFSLERFETSFVNQFLPFSTGGRAATEQFRVDTQRVSNGAERRGWDMARVATTTTGARGAPCPTTSGEVPVYLGVRRLRVQEEINVPCPFAGRGVGMARSRVSGVRFPTGTA